MACAIGGTRHSAYPSATTAPAPAPAAAERDTQPAGPGRARWHVCARWPQPVRGQQRPAGTRSSSSCRQAPPDAAAPADAAAWPSSSSGGSSVRSHTLGAPARVVSVQTATSIASTAAALAALQPTIAGRRQLCGHQKCCLDANTHPHCAHRAWRRAWQCWHHTRPRSRSGCCHAPHAAAAALAL
jgi:hypothetical protein